MFFRQYVGGISLETFSCVHSHQHPLQVHSTHKHWSVFSLSHPHTLSLTPNPNPNPLSCASCRWSGPAVRTWPCSWLSTWWCWLWGSPQFSGSAARRPASSGPASSTASAAKSTYLHCTDSQPLFVFHNYCTTVEHGVLSSGRQHTVEADFYRKWF